MACVALASLMSTIKLEFLQPIPRVPLHHQTPLIHSFIEMISSLQAFVEKSSGGAAAIKDLEIEIREFALKAEDAIEIHLSSFLLAKNRDGQEKASQELHQTLQEAAKKAAELLNNVIDRGTSNNEADDDEENETHHHWLKHAPEFENSKFVGRMVGSHRDHTDLIHQLTGKHSELNPN